MSRALDVDFLISLGGLLRRGILDSGLGTLRGIGAYDGVQAGQGGDFRELRPYAYGDDPRQIDWRVSARKNEVYFRERYRSQDRRLRIVLDWQSSMFFGTQGGLKADLAAENAVAFLWQMVHQQQSANLTIISDEGVDEFFIKGANALIHTIEQMAHQYARISANPLIKEALVFSDIIKEDAIIISDFHQLKDKDWRVAAAISHQFSMRLIAIADRVEYQPLSSGNPYRSARVVGYVPNEHTTLYEEIRKRANANQLAPTLMHYQYWLPERLVMTQRILQG